MNSKDSRDPTAFYMACGTGHFDLMKTFMKNSQELGIDLLAHEDYSRPQFHLTCLNDLLDVAQFLIERSED